MDEHEPDRRRNTWTLWREIYGTIIGMIPVMMPVVVILIVWGSTVQSRLSVHDVELEHVKQLVDAERATAREDRVEQSRKLDHISAQIEALQQIVAHDGGRNGR